MSYKGFFLPIASWKTFKTSQFLSLSVPVLSPLRCLMFINDADINTFPFVINWLNDWRGKIRLLKWVYDFSTQKTHSFDARTFCSDGDRFCVGWVVLQLFDSTGSRSAHCLILGHAVFKPRRHRLGAGLGSLSVRMKNPNAWGKFVH